MPKRTNDFQRLIFLIEQQLAPSGAVVRESQCVRDHRTGDPREIDILIEQPSGIHAVVIALECIDHRRRASVTWVEQMRAKHHDVPVHKTILVSQAGFTKAALVKAQAYNKETITLDDALTTDWARIVDKLASLNLTMCLRRPLQIKIHFATPVPEDLDRKTLTYYHPTGEPLGDPRQFLERSFFADPKIQAIEDSIAHHASKEVRATVLFPPGTYALDPHGNMYAVTSWGITVTITKDVSLVPLQRSSYTSSAVVAHGNLRSFGADATAVFVERKGAPSAQCTISFHNRRKPAKRAPRSPRKHQRP